MKDEILNYKYKAGKQQIFPTHNFVKNWVFEEDEEEEAALAHHFATVACKNGVSRNEIQNLFPAVLRMLKSESSWSK